MNKKRIPIFFATDDNYLRYLSVTLISIEKYASDDYIYDVKILTAGLSEKNKAAIKNLNTPHIQISIVDLEHRVKSIRHKLKSTLRDYYSESIFYRIFIPSLFPRIDRALYLDCDIVLCDDIAKLYFTDIGDNVLGAVRDESIKPIPEFCEYVEKVVGAPEGKYFNSGVLLINADEFRLQKIEEKMLFLLNEYNFPTVAPDQDYLNFLCGDKVYYFDFGWNKQPNQNADFNKNELHLIHYNMFNKPWHYDGVLYEEFFWRFAKESPFYEEICEEKKCYTEKQRQLDAEAAKKLIGSTKEILEKRCSFCHVIGSDFYAVKN